MSAFGITGFGFFCLAVFALNLTGPDSPPTIVVAA